MQLKASLYYQKVVQLGACVQGQGLLSTAGYGDSGMLLITYKEDIDGEEMDFSMEM